MKAFFAARTQLLFTILLLGGILAGGLVLAATSSRNGSAKKAGEAKRTPRSGFVDGLCPPIAFSHSTIVDFSATSGEPFINSAPVTIAPNTPAGSPFISVPFGLSTTVSILWKSIDGGRSFINLGVMRDAVPGPGGGDTHQDFDAIGRFYYSDLAAACVTVAVSDDGGNSFTKISALTCVGPNDPGGITDDRQWSGGFGDGLGYMTTRNLAVSLGSNFHLARTRDAGVTWNSFNQPIGTVSQSGPLVFDKTKRNIGGTDYIVGYQIYHTGGTALKMLRLRDDDTGAATVAVDDIDIITPGGSVATVFPMIAVGRDGGLYVVWSNGNQIRMVTSQDFGESWSNIKVVSGEAPPAGKIMPWAIAGDAGRANIVWYQSTEGLGTELTNRWQIHMAQTLNGYAAAPSFETATVSEHTIHFGEICLRGLACDIDGSDRSFLEFPSITLDDRGAAMITWNDNTNQAAATVAAPQVAGAPYVMFAKQTRGPSLFAEIGTVDAGPGSVTITQPTNGQAVTSAPLEAAGTHTLPPGTFDNDEIGDAIFPFNGPALGPNLPGADLRKVTVTDDATNIVVTMEIGDTAAAAITAAHTTSSGDGMLYLAQWDYDESEAEAIDRVFWVAAEVRGGVPVGRTGTLGVIRSATSKKFIVYNPVLTASAQVDAVITPGTPGTVTLTIPRSVVGSPPEGARLKSFVAYAMTEHGPLVPCEQVTEASCESVFTTAGLPTKLDASRAFTYVMGGGPQFDGAVEFSLDDPTFANPRSATLDPANLNWEGQLHCTELTPGAHTLYVRQTINCNVSSPVVSTPFNVPAGAIPVCVVSRKVHGDPSKTFDIVLPQGDDPGIECRRAGASDTHTMVFKFAAAVTDVGMESVTAGDGSMPGISGEISSADSTEYIVTLTGVNNRQYLTVALGDVETATETLSLVEGRMGVLLGDVNSSVRVDGGDVLITRQQQFRPLTQGNFRADVNASGRIDGGDTLITRQRDFDDIEDAASAPAKDGNAR